MKPSFSKFHCLGVYSFLVFFLCTSAWFYITHAKYSRDTVMSDF